jgi:hypothetical protein
LGPSSPVDYLRWVWNSSASTAVTAPKRFVT